jgi:hypothetical protein
MIRESCEEMVGRNMDIYSTSDEVSDGNKSMLLETGRKVILVIKWQKNLAELCPYVL